MPLGELLTSGFQVSEGLQAAHEKGDVSYRRSAALRSDGYDTGELTLAANTDAVLRVGYFTGQAQYFSIQSASSRTLILPCQGFCSSEWPSPGKSSSELGTPRTCSACSSR